MRLDIMFFAEDLCIFCNRKWKPDKRHWCPTTQIMISLILLQYKYASGNVHSSDLRKTLSSQIIGFSESRVTKTLNLLKQGDLSKCTYCHDELNCTNYTCKYPRTAHDCKASCHNCVECDLIECYPLHSYVKLKRDVSDPRREFIWISAAGLSQLAKWEDIYISRNKQKSIFAQKVEVITA